MSSEADARSDAAQAGDAHGTAFLIAGAGGMLGTALQRVISASGATLSAPSEATFDITDEGSVRAQVERFAQELAPGQRGVLVNAAAYTNVERAQDEPELAYLVNVSGAALLALTAHEAGLGFVHVSTDFVFDGTKEGAYCEDDEPHPLSVYGITKLAGERAVLAENPGTLIVRTAWVFGPAGVNFPLKILEAARARPSLEVVTDEIGSPTYTVDLAAGILGLVAVGARGLYHLAGTGSCSRYELASEVLRLAGVDTPLQPVTAERFPVKAARPANSVLDCSKAASVGVTMPPWRDGLARYLAETGVSRG
jgi:dTDP-4-dehydrorhamnose reductase